MEASGGKEGAVAATAWHNDREFEREVGIGGRHTRTRGDALEEARALTSEEINNEGGDRRWGGRWRRWSNGVWVKRTGAPYRTRWRELKGDGGTDEEALMTAERVVEHFGGR